MSYLDSKRIVGTNADRTGSFANVTGGWKELARTTLGSAGDNIDITSLPDKRYYMYLLHRDTCGSTSGRMTFNDDSGSNYSTRYASDGTEYTATNQAYVSQHTSSSQDSFTYGYIANKSDKEKLIQSWIVGNASPPSRYEQFWKWTNTSSAINRMDIFNHLGGDFASGSELVVLGWDPDDTHTDNFWEELASVDLSSGTADDLSSGTFTAKKYLWVQAFMEQCSSSITGNATFNSDTGSNYSRRRSNNGAADSTATSESAIDVRGGETKNRFENMFIINNSAQQKLVIGNMVVANPTAGAGTAPDRTEYVARWSNTSSQITSINFNNIDPGNFGTKSFIKVWGAD